MIQKCSKQRKHTRSFGFSERLTLLYSQSYFIFVEIWQLTYDTNTYKLLRRTPAPFYTQLFYLQYSAPMIFQTQYNLIFGKQFYVLSNWNHFFSILFLNSGDEEKEIITTKNERFECKQNEWIVKSIMYSFSIDGADIRWITVWYYFDIFQTRIGVHNILLELVMFLTFMFLDLTEFERRI